MMNQNVLRVVLGLTLGMSAITTTSCGREVTTMQTEHTNQDTHTEREKTVLCSALAGTWYSADGVTLRKEIEGYLDQVKQDRMPDVMALILPHAGYRYSGSVAAYGVHHVRQGHYKRVVIIGPTHRYPIQNAVSVPDVTHYKTPLGEAPIDLDFVARLREFPFVISHPEAHLEEHSVQIELPLIQVALNDFKIVPIVCGQLSTESAREIGAALRSLVDEETLVVASTDFTHYGDRFGYVPFREDVPDSLRRLDLGAYALIEQKNVDGFATYVSSTGATICGRNPISLLLAMLPDDAKAHLLKYDTSGRITGDFNNSVSYLAAAFTGRWSPMQNDKNESSDATLSPHDKDQLLKLARATLTHRMTTGEEPSAATLDIEITEGMKQTMGAFVTLHKKGNLRGCIGEIVPRRALYEAVMDHAINSALRDHRFPALQESELDEIDFEISALSQPTPVASYHDIVIGKHGVVLQKGMRSSVFLPQVAPEQGWDVETTLTHLAMKAGLQPDAWKSGAEFMVFEAIVFGEE